MLKTVVIGAGVISKEHLTFLAQSAEAQPVGVCDLSTAAARYAQQRFGVKQAYTDYRVMLEEERPDVVHILTPPHTHKKLAMDCLQAGAHVICEKPITPSFAEFEELWATAQSCKRTLMENQNFRYNRKIVAIRDLVTAGVLGDVQEVEVRMALDIRGGGRFADTNLPSPLHQLPAGVIHDFLPHMAYLAWEYLPAFERIGAAWSNHGGGDLFKYDDLDALVMGGQIHARLRFSCHTQPDCFYFAVRGTRGYAETDLYQPYLRCVIPRGVGKQLSPIVNHVLSGWELMSSGVKNLYGKVMQHSPYEGLHILLDKTYKALSRNEKVPIDYEDIAQTCQLMEALLAEKNRI